MANTQVTPTHEVNRNDDTDGGRETSQPEKERASRNADIGAAPEQGGTRQQSDATYEPDKKPSKRDTM